MTRMKTLTVLMLLSAAVATPAFAKGKIHHETFRRAYDQVEPYAVPSYAVPSSQAERNIENFGFSGRDPSRVGGWDPSLHPSD
jgi:hypothetical protein